MGKYKLRWIWMFVAALAGWAALGQEKTPEAIATPRGAYLLGPDDVISIRAVDAEEISDKSIRIGPNGAINLPMVGRVQAGGLTPDDLEKELAVRLKPFIRNPQVSVNVVELKSQPVSVIGSVNSSGVHQLQGRKTLLEMLSLAGGVRPDAGYSVKITRQKEWGPIPLPSAKPDVTGQFTVAELNLKSIMEAKNPADNILVMPNDVISVPKGEMLYVIGEVKRPGGFVLSDSANLSVLQALSLASGLEKTAASSRAKILRASTTPDQKRTEIAVDLKKVLQGKNEDVAMRPDDILFVPNSKSRSATIRALEIAAQIGTGIAIYRSY